LIVTPDPDETPAFFKRLDQTEQILANIGLVLSGVVFAAGLAGLVYVVINIQSTSPPSFGSQGEWLYGGVACLLVAGWGFGQAAKFFARLRKAVAPAEGLRAPRIQIGSEGLSIELPPPQTRDATEKRSPGGFTWSFTSDPIPFKTFKLDEAQLAAADAAAGSGADWDAVCRQVNPEYAAWSDFEQSLYRHAVQSAIEGRRRAASQNR
jgi:hypothetical protein